MPRSADGAFLQLKDGDNVAVALRRVAEGLDVAVGSYAVRAHSTIEPGHKIALVPIRAGEAVLKYGETIGRANRAIEPGEHVHVHNVDGVRGRGDLAEAGATGGER